MIEDKPFVSKAISKGDLEDKVKDLSEPHEEVLDGFTKDFLEEDLVLHSVFGEGRLRSFKNNDTVVCDFSGSLRVVELTSLKHR